MILDVAARARVVAARELSVRMRVVVAWSLRVRVVAARARARPGYSRGLPMMGDSLPWSEPLINEWEESESEMRCIDDGSSGVSRVDIRGGGVPKVANLSGW